MASLILNADDFGASPTTNEAILRAHREGVLTSASMMVAGPAAEEAIRLARGRPTLAVGLHLVLSDGLPSLPASAVPHLAPGGRFRKSPALAGLACFFSRGARREAEREVAAQFERFAASGLPCDHVNGHQHLHMHPVVWDAMLRQCEVHGVRAVRIPYEEFVPAGSGAHAGRRVEWLFFRALRRRCLRAVTAHRLVVADRVYGHIQTGDMHEEYVLGLLGRLAGASDEVYFHPGTEHARSLTGAGMDVDLHALLSPRVRDRIAERGLRLTTYGSLAAEQAQAGSRAE